MCPKSFFMATYQDLKRLHSEGFKVLKTKFYPRDNTLESAIESGSNYKINYAIKCEKDKLKVVKTLLEANIPISRYPKLAGYYLQYKGTLNYETVVANKNPYEIYVFLKNAQKEFGDDEVDRLYKKFLDDGFKEDEILFYNLPKEIKEILYQKDKNAAIDAVVEYYKNNHPKVNFIIYDFIRNSKNAIFLTEELLKRGIPKELIGSTALVSVVSKKITLQELRVLYDFNFAHFIEIMEYMLENPTLFKYKDALSVAEKMVYAGIDKNTILTGMRSL